MQSHEDDTYDEPETKIEFTKAERYDLLKFLKGWNLGPHQMNAIEVAVAALVDKLLHPLSTRMGEIERDIKELKDVKTDVEALTKLQSEWKGAQRVVNWLIGFVAFVGTVIGVILGIKALL